MLRKICFMLAVAALLTATLSKSTDTAKASPDMQTITLNTGYDHPSQRKYNPIGLLDAFWTVVQDPSPSTQEPRPANTINKHAAWSAAQGESQWISYSQSGSAPAPVKGTYVYQKCFCLTKALWENPEAIRQSSLDVSVRADDAFYLGLNTTPDPNVPASYLLATTTGVGGGFNGNPMTLSIKGEKLLRLLRPGSNCLTVRVEDTGQVITGLNLMGSLTTTGVDGIASSAPPNPASQFAACSACSKTRPDRAVEVRDAVKNTVGIRVPEE
jgi:hypothetical protein